MPTNSLYKSAIHVGKYIIWYQAHGCYGIWINIQGFAINVAPFEVDEMHEKNKVKVHCLYRNPLDVLIICLVVL